MMCTMRPAGQRRFLIPLHDLVRGLPIAGLEMLQRSPEVQLRTGYGIIRRFYSLRARASFALGRSRLAISHFWKLGYLPRSYLMAKKE